MTYDRLAASDATVLFVDHQTGLANGVQTHVEFLSAKGAR
jgi:hypothetical protein